MVFVDSLGLAGQKVLRLPNCVTTLLRRSSKALTGLRALVVLGDLVIGRCREEAWSSWRHWAACKAMAEFEGADSGFGFDDVFSAVPCAGSGG